MVILYITASVFFSFYTTVIFNFIYLRTRRNVYPFIVTFNIN